MPMSWYPSQLALMVLLCFTLKLHKVFNFLQEKFTQIDFFASFQFFFLLVFLVNINILFQYEQSHISKQIGASTFMVPGEFNP
jgi:hypothetical protein